MFAVIRTGGKQYKVAKNDRISVEKLDTAEGKTVDLDDVLAISDGKKLAMGKDAKGAKVSAKVVEQSNKPKITVFKKKRRQNYRRTKGHKQPQTILEITEIKAA